MSQQLPNDAAVVFLCGNFRQFDGFTIQSINLKNILHTSFAIMGGSLTSVKIPYSVKIRLTSNAARCTMIAQSKSLDARP